MTINTPDPRIARHYPRWKRNRDFIEGEYAVKGCKTAYLPLASSKQEEADYLIYLDNVEFYPAASKTVDGWMGLMFRLAPALVAGDLMAQLCKCITASGDELDELAEVVAREILVTDFTGLLVDHAPSMPGLSLANAVAQGFRPFVGVYPAENILEVSQAFVGGMKRISYVRLLDDDATVRELALEDGIYVVRIHKDGGDGFNLVSETVPMRNGKPMTDIPFVLVNTSNSITPTTAPADHSVNLNLNHYRVQGRLTLSHMFASYPQAYICGVSQETADELFRSPQVVWTFEDSDTKVDYLEYSGAGVGSIEKKLDKLEVHLGNMGGRIIAADKIAAEAAETLSIRRASENAILAAISRTISRKIKVALQMVSDWVDGGEVDFALNTDFVPTPMSAAEQTATTATVQAGILSRQSAFDRMVEGEVVNVTHTWEEEQRRLAADKAAGFDPLATPATPAIAPPTADDTAA